MKDYKECILQCDLVFQSHSMIYSKAIKINNEAMKARYRKALAYLELDEYEKSSQVLSLSGTVNMQRKLNKH